MRGWTFQVVAETDHIFSTSEKFASGLDCIFGDGVFESLELKEFGWRYYIYLFLIIILIRPNHFSYCDK